MILYHLTPIKNLSSIMQKGFIAGKGRGLSELCYDDPYWVREFKGGYGADNLESLGEVIADSSNKSRGRKKFAIIKIDVPSHFETEEDCVDVGEFPYSLTGTWQTFETRERISPSRITYLGSVTLPGDGRPPVYDVGKEFRQELDSGFSIGEMRHSLIPGGRLTTDEERLPYISNKREEFKGRPLIQQFLDAAESGEDY